MACLLVCLACLTRSDLHPGCQAGWTLTALVEGTLAWHSKKHRLMHLVHMKMVRVCIWISHKMRIIQSIVIFSYFNIISSIRKALDSISLALKACEAHQRPAACGEMNR